MFNYRTRDCIQPLVGVYPEFKKIQNPIALSKPILGSIFWCNLGRPGGSVQGGIRPCLVYDNLAQNASDVIPLTTSIKATHLPSHIIIRAGELSGLQKDSMVLCEQMRCVGNECLFNPLGILAYKEFQIVDNAMNIQMPLPIDPEDEKKKTKMLKKYFNSIIPVIKGIKGIKNI